MLMKEIFCVNRGKKSKRHIFCVFEVEKKRRKYHVLLQSLRLTRSLNAYRYKEVRRKAANRGETFSGTAIERKKPDKRLHNFFTKQAGKPSTLHIQNPRKKMRMLHNIVRKEEKKRKVYVIS